jgi:RimJ/RimL family protein N-acetyltransferase
MSSLYRPMGFSIETERLVLQLRGPDDASWNLELVGEHDGGTTLTLDDARRRLAEQEIAARDSGIGLLAIRRRAEGDPIGYCGLIVGRGSLDEPEIAYELLRRFHGHGYATEAARAVMDAAFATGRSRLWSTVRPWNAPSFRVLEKLGFRRDHSTVDDKGELVYLVRDATQSPREQQEHDDSAKVAHREGRAGGVRPWDDCLCCPSGREFRGRCNYIRRRKAFPIGVGPRSRVLGASAAALRTDNSMAPTT